MSKRVSGKLLYGHRELNPGLCDNLEGWDGVGGGRLRKEGTCAYLWLIRIVWQSQHNIVKQLFCN